MLSSCAMPSPTAQSSPTTAASTPSASASVLAAESDLYSPGLAQQVVSELVDATGGEPIVRVVISRTQARVTYIGSGDRPSSMVWSNGVITPSDDGTDLVAATSFDPNTFDLSDIAALFTEAALLSGSNEKQELQINEYDHGQVLMTVTTTPESSTVFFDRDGAPIPRLDLTDDADLAAGLDDVYDTRLLVLQVGVTVSAGDTAGVGDQVWADVVTTPDMVERRIRTATVPMFLTQRHETPSNQQFDQTLIDPAVIAQLIRTAPVQLEQPDATDVTITVDQPSDADAPQITVAAGGQQMITDLDGVKIES